MSNLRQKIEALVRELEKCAKQKLHGNTATTELVRQMINDRQTLIDALKSTCKTLREIALWIETTEEIRWTPEHYERVMGPVRAALEMTKGIIEDQP